MAEWSNAVDSKSIVLFTGYLGFESLSLRHLQQSPRKAGFVVNDEERRIRTLGNRVRLPAKGGRKNAGRLEKADERLCNSSYSAE